MTTKEAHHWDDWNLAHRSGSINDTTRTLFQTALDAFNALSLPERPRVLEVGCGCGWIAESLAQKCDYIGLDIAPAAIDVARQRVPHAHFEVADFHDWPLPDEPFDAIICVNAIAYFRDQDSAVRKFARALRPGGGIILTTVNPFVYKRIWRVRPPGEGQARNWLTRTALHSLLVRHSFHVQRSWTILPIGDKGVLRFINGRIAEG